MSLVIYQYFRATVLALFSLGLVEMNKAVRAQAEFILPTTSVSFEQSREMWQSRETNRIVATQEDSAIAQDIELEETQQVTFQFDFGDSEDLEVNRKILRSLTSEHLNESRKNPSSQTKNLFQTTKIAGRDFLTTEIPVRVLENQRADGSCDVETEFGESLEFARAFIQQKYFQEGYLLNFVNCFTIKSFNHHQESGEEFSNVKKIFINVSSRKIRDIYYEIAQKDDNSKESEQSTVIEESEDNRNPCKLRGKESDLSEESREKSTRLEEENTFLKKEILCDRLRSILGREGDIIHYRAIEDNLAYWKTNPLVDNIEVYLKEVEGADNVYDLNIIIDPEEEEQLLLSLDNSSPESVGDEKFSLAYVHNNPEKIGDRFILGYTGTTSGGIRAVNLGYEIPLGVTDKYLAFNFAPSWTRVTQRPFSKFDITARSQLASVEYRHPLIRSLEEELSFSVGFEYQNGRTFIFNNIPTAFGNGSNDDGVTRTSYFTFGQRYARRSPNGAWAIDSKFTFGTDLFGATAGRWNESGGIFNSWKLFGQRIQKLGKDHKLVIEAQLQLSPKTLPSSYQFSIGGPNTVRGYRSNARTADNGVRFSIEDYIVLDRDESGASHTEIIPFIDLGYVWNNPDTSNGLLDQRFLLSTGIGFQWHKLFGFDDLTARLDIAYPFFNIDDRGQALQDDGIYFLINYNLF
ncbi:surface antigen (D15) [[Leptolyngbya] sp. PCC 7376]|uniref:ShlB/FhaC/HecB family hemolysin secretion/activation protein n=1 Tax=[Leptolyngbya] sp. PCC 7376 TaxID=111781 RepID=UPI00029F1BF9|nr:ShlB/FhaC/HecB family hemolysin secretion/activation protein [[Leptolyngbya] sp. PCC 7376]AFY37953.1 surface antigen (D15) [[Leptolyngbya] sp. PCC 7376]